MQRFSGQSQILTPSQQPHPSLSDPFPILSFPNELLRIITGMALEDLSPVDFNARAKELSLLSKWMKPHAQYHLFRNETITFNGNGEELVKGKGFEDWCKTMASYDRDDPKPSGAESCVGEVTANRDSVSPLFGSIHYNGENLGGISLRDDSDKYIVAFSNVKRLKLSCILFRDLHKIPDFKLLGSMLRTLSLDRCRMDLNQLVQYLLPFKNLERLEIFDVRFDKSKVVPSKPLPSFKGALKLSLRKLDGRLFMRELSKIQNMRHSRIILEGAITRAPGSTELLNTFLSKFQNTLTHLRINSELTPPISGVWLFGC